MVTQCVLRAGGDPDGYPADRRRGQCRVNFRATARGVLRNHHGQTASTRGLWPADPARHRPAPGILVVSVIRFPSAESEPPSQSIVQATLVSTETTTDQAQRATEPQASSQADETSEDEASREAEEAEAEAQRQREAEEQRQREAERQRQAEQERAELSKRPRPPPRKPSAERRRQGLRPNVGNSKKPNVSARRRKRHVGSARPKSSVDVRKKPRSVPPKRPGTVSIVPSPVRPKRRPMPSKPSKRPTASSISFGRPSSRPG